MSQSLKYYIYLDDSVQGPHDLEYIKSMNLEGSTKLCLEGSTDWTSLESLQSARKNSDFLNDLVGYSNDYMPTKIGKYNIVNEIGRGGMGSVYLALDEVLNRKVAVKELKIDEHKKRDPEAYNTMIRRFKKEAQILAQLNHKNIVSVFDIVEQNQSQYIIMEYLDGSNLEEKLDKEGSLPLLEAVSIIADTCLALDYIHKRNIIHRDVKPSNIVILSDGVVKLTDFGVTRDLNSATMTMDGSLVGTIAYASPEQDSRDLDGRSDIFSLGVVLYELITGQKPFVGDTIASVLLKIATKDPAKPSDINPKIHKMLENIVTKAMAKSLSQRYTSSMDMYNDLINYKQALEENNITLLAGQKIIDNKVFNKIDSIPPGKVNSKDLFKNSMPPSRIKMEENIDQINSNNDSKEINTANLKSSHKDELKADFKTTTFIGQPKNNTEINNIIDEVKELGTGNLANKIPTSGLSTINLENKSVANDLSKSEKATKNKLKNNQKVEVEKNPIEIKKFLLPIVISIFSIIIFALDFINFLDLILMIGTICGIHYDYNKTSLLKPLSYMLTLTSIFVIYFTIKLMLPSFDNSKISTLIYYVLDISIFLISVITSFLMIKGLDNLSINKEKSLRPISTLFKSILLALSIILIISCTDIVNIASVKSQFEKSKFINIVTSIYKDFKPGKKLNLSIGKFGLKIDK